MKIISPLSVTPAPSELSTLQRGFRSWHRLQAMAKHVTVVNRNIVVVVVRALYGIRLVCVVTKVDSQTRMSKLARLGCDWTFFYIFSDYFSTFLPHL